ncbi:ATP-dependent RNA helicase DBP5 [Pochonia chlamydosporia 170]|uniref:RNA helicase n=1 Tax=Pochonia chlamydosporia 170 TaxID=1380566 RepID=A0A179F8Q2_METCM|nr:ATP-dependent RNA helicase DBP5 [Pochonia chlamydosporia 170]OAQ61806.1 ATP-dependent RNA helicase DBP5 [Pochonia chlamydosporia 170]
MADLASRITDPNESTTDTAKDASAASNAQVDGASAAIGGSALHEADGDVEVTISGGDNEAPIYSASTWDDLGLSEHILKGLLAENFLKPSKIQGRSLPLMLSNPPKNMVAQSQSGTGKTVAFLTASLSRIDFTQPEQPQALILAPTQELADQIYRNIHTIGRFIENLKVALAIPQRIPRGEAVRASVVVGTPGTVLDLGRRKQLDGSKLKVLVLDEADNMLDQAGLGDQCLRVKLQLLPPDTRASIQVLLFSATFPARVKDYIPKFAPNANSLTLKTKELTVKGISQMFIDCPDENARYDILCKLYGLMTIGQSVIFVKTRKSANEIQRRMTDDGHKVTVLHGEFDSNERQELLAKFRSGESKVLITTNLLSRGIDVSSVSMVINYDIPMKPGPKGDEPDAETYLHRIGRTGRFGRIGVSISFVYDQKSFDSLSAIALHFGIDLVNLPTDDWDEAEEKVKQVIKKNSAQAAYVPKVEDNQPAPASAS